MSTPLPHWRHLLIRATLLLALLVAGAACGGDNNGPTGPSGSGTMTARVDGATWTATSGIVALTSNNIVSITGSVGAVSHIAIAWPSSGTGTYTIPGAVGMNANYGTFANGHLWQAFSITTADGVGTGSVTVTTLNAERVVGTFQFTAPGAASSGASGQKVVTNGAFNIAF